MVGADIVADIDGSGYPELPVPTSLKTYAKRVRSSYGLWELLRMIPHLPRHA